MKFIMVKTFSLSIATSWNRFYTQIGYEKVFSFFLIALFLIALLIMMESELPVAYAQDTSSPTPTYDSLAEHFPSENPSEFEVGRNWYWHNCMTCHGDLGQGLTDGFRAIWPEDHQNCWEYGCHGGGVASEIHPSPSGSMMIYIGLGIALIFAVIWGIKKRSTVKKNDNRLTTELAKQQNPTRIKNHPSHLHLQL